MKERPILFSAPMVVALLAGTKTQTRRLVKPQPEGERGLLRMRGMGGFAAPHVVAAVAAGGGFNPYGVPGDRLWVKETWRPVASIPRRLNHYGLRIESVQYAADRGLETRQVARGWKKPKAAKTGNVSPLFMPRWASRLTLEVTSVRVERLNAIAEAGAIAEGILRVGLPKDRRPLWQVGHEQHESAVAAYSALWESINGPGSWDANPWCWVIEFRRVDGGAA